MQGLRTTAAYINFLFCTELLIEALKAYMKCINLRCIIKYIHCWFCECFLKVYERSPFSIHCLHFWFNFLWCTSLPRCPHSVSLTSAIGDLKQATWATPCYLPESAVLGKARLGQLDPEVGPSNYTKSHSRKHPDAAWRPSLPSTPTLPTAVNSSQLMKIKTGKRNSWRKAM